MKTSRGCGWWLGRILLGFATLVVIVILAGCVYQTIGEANDARAFPPPGQMVDEGGYDLHLYCTGEGSPAVILEALAGGTSSEWGWVQPQVAEVTRVCAYDRAGRAWSESSGQSQTLRGTAEGLHTLLGNAGVAGPYILVGHSIGGVYAREFQSLYPDEVAGIVLVDSAHPNQLERYPEMVQATQAYVDQSAIFPLLARVGLFRLYFATGNEIDFGGLPKRQHDELAAEWSSPDYFESQRAETIAALETIYKDAAHLGTLGDLPLIVISAAQSSENWRTLQDELATLSTNALHETIRGSNHGSLAFDEAPATRVSELIKEMVGTVRGKSGR